MSCHVLGHVQPCKSSFCASIEREHDAVRTDERRLIVAMLRRERDSFQRRCAAATTAFPIGARDALDAVADMIEEDQHHKSAQVSSPAKGEP